MRTLVDDCEFVLVEHHDYCSIMSKVAEHIHKHSDGLTGEIVSETETRLTLPFHIRSFAFYALPLEEGAVETSFISSKTEADFQPITYNRLLLPMALSLIARADYVKQLSRLYTVGSLIFLFFNSV